MKKYFFVVTSAIQIILLLIVIANVPHIVEEQMKAIEESQALISSMFEEVNTSTKSNDIDVPKEQVALESNFFNDFISKEYLERIFYFSAILIIIFNLVIIEIASSKNILKHRARVITYLLISMLLGINI